LNVDGWFERKYLNKALDTLKLQNAWPHYDVNGTIIPR